MHYAVTCHEYFIMKINVGVCLKMSEYAGKCQKCSNRIEMSGFAGKVIENAEWFKKFTNCQNTV